MRIPKKVRELPWPEPFTGVDNMHFRVTVQQPAVDGERLLVVTFTMNGARKNAMRWTSASQKDLRLVCSKKHRTAAILARGDRAYRRVSLSEALYAAARTRPDYCYPEISETHEAVLTRWLGAKDKTGNHRMPELAHWVEEAVEAETVAEKQRRGEIMDEDVGLCPSVLPEGLVDYVRRVVLEGSALYAADAVDNVVTLQRGLEDGVLFLRKWRLERDPTARWEDTAAGKKLLAAKLELGSVQTLAHQDSSGAWVLNEIPDYAEQLRRCQRYLYVQKANTRVNASGVLTSGKTAIYFGVTVPVPMRALPALLSAPSVVQVRTTAGGNVDPVVSEVSVYAQSSFDAMITLRAATETFNADGYTNNTPVALFVEDLRLSAEL